MKWRYLILLLVVTLILGGCSKAPSAPSTPSSGEGLNPGMLSPGQIDSTMVDKAVKVRGKVVDGSIEWKAKKLELRFAIAEGSATLPVIYKGAKPDGFKAGADIVVEGKYHSDKVFRASTILMKCPSKYVPEE